MVKANFSDIYRGLKMWHHMVPRLKHPRWGGTHPEICITRAAASSQKAGVRGAKKSEKEHPHGVQKFKKDYSLRVQILAKLALFFTYSSILAICVP